MDATETRWTVKINVRRLWIIAGFTTLVLLGYITAQKYDIMKLTLHIRGDEDVTGRVPTKYTGNICQKQMQIAFIKIHKTASTTITSILQRFGLFNNLTFALPRSSNWRISLFETISASNVLPGNGPQTYDILCQHVIYNKTAFRRMMPTDTAIIASIREPFHRFVSSFMFFKEYRYEIGKKANISTNDVIGLMRTYMRNPSKYEPKMFQRGSIVLNRIPFSLGLSPTQYANNSLVKNYIKQLDTDLTFVLVVEMLDECLVLLKRKLCWSMKDIFYQWRYKGRLKPHIPPDLRKLHKKLANSEYIFYSHFYNKVLDELSSQKKDFFDETKLFKSNLQKVQSFCGGNQTGSDVLRFPASEFEGMFTFTTADCRFLRMSETNFVKYLKRRQARQYTGTSQ